LSTHGVCVEAAACFLDLHGEKMRGFKAGIDGEEMMHAAEEQAGADEEDEGEGDLDDDQKATGGMTAADGASGVLFEAGAEVGTGGVKRGDEAYDDAEDGGDGKRKQKDSAMETDGADTRKAGRAERDEGLDSACGDDCSAEGAKDGEEQALGEKLADETCLGCS
jgi:hypothetical protein